MEKIVTKGKHITSVELDGTECAVVFSSKFKAFEIKNNSSKEVIVSLEQGVSDGDGVIVLGSGESLNYIHPRYYMSDTIYLTGTGNVLVAAKNDGTLVFPVKRKGGGSDKSSSIKTSLIEYYGIFESIITGEALYEEE